MPLNQFQQDIGQPLPNWHSRPAPSKIMIRGQYCRLEPLNSEQHSSDLYEAYQKSENEADWTYLSIGPFETYSDYETYIKTIQNLNDYIHYAIVDNLTNKALGTFALMRIDCENGSIEVGFVVYSILLKHTVIATEAQFLLMQYVFDELGYRRYEWKCDSLNIPSRNAALRLGFKFEGIFRNAVVYKGRSRDTAWFSIIDTEWSDLQKIFLKWLDTNNFDINGQQKQSLSDFKTNIK